MQKINLNLSLDALVGIRESLSSYLILIDSELKKEESPKTVLTKRRETANLAMSELMNAIAE